MRTPRNALAAASTVAFLAAGLALAAPAAGATIATDPPPVVIAQDPSPPPAPVPARVVGIDANVVNGLTITGHVGRPISASAKGQPTRTATAAPQTPVVLRNLSPGVKYTISFDGKAIGTGVPLAQVGATTALTVTTTSTPGTVDATWTYTRTPAQTRTQGAVTFALAATVLRADGTPDSSPAATTTVTATDTSGELTGLNPNARYRFSVEARNSASTGRASAATTTDTLAVLSGLTTTPTPVATAPADPTPAPPPPPPSPGTKTIYVCPDGYSEITGGMCQKTLPYTFHKEVAGPAPILDSYETDSGSCPVGYNYENYGWVAYCRLYGPVPMKDVKDPTPTGYVDNGTQWVSIVPKIAVQVPA